MIEANATPPTGVAASMIEIDQDAPSLQLRSDDAGNLPFVAESTDPLGDWSQAVITDVRTWIGTTEVANTLAGAGVSVTGAGSPTDAVIDLDGRVVGGSGNLTRDFLQSGTISFVVDGATPTVLTLAMTESEAQTAYPDLNPPQLVGRSTINTTQYVEGAVWSPVHSWGSGDPGAITLAGALPQGMSWDPWWYELAGTAEETGTFPVTLTAHGDYGMATKTYDIVVGSPPTAPQNPLGQIWVYDYQDELDADVADVYLAAIGYFRIDNPAFDTSLPVVDDFYQEGYLFDGIDDVAFYDANGNPLPIDGDATLEMISDSPDYLGLQATVHRTDAGTGPIADLLSGGGRITFTYQGGQTNTVQFAPWN